MHSIPSVNQRRGRSRLRLGVVLHSIDPVNVAWTPVGSDRRTASRGLLTRLLAEAGLADDLVQQCRHCGARDHGPLRTASGRAVVSVSYTGDLAVVAFARSADAVALGIDAEELRVDGQMTDLAPLFSPALPPGIRDWTAIEAVVKADGRGLRIPPGDVRLLDGTGTTPHSRRALLPDGSAFDVIDVPAPAGYTVSAAVSAAIRSVASGSAPGWAR